MFAAASCLGFGLGFQFVMGTLVACVYSGWGRRHKVGRAHVDAGRGKCTLQTCFKNVRHTAKVDTPVCTHGAVRCAVRVHLLVCA